MSAWPVCTSTPNSRPISRYDAPAFRSSNARTRRSAIASAAQVERDRGGVARPWRCPAVAAGQADGEPKRSATQRRLIC